MNNHSDKNGKVYKFRPKDQNFKYKEPKVREFPKGKVGDDAGDIDLMMIFGMEGEAKSKDPEHYGQVKKDLENQKVIMGKQEYVVPTQKEEFLKKYKDGVKSAKRRIVPTAIMLVVCILLEVFVFYNEELFQKIQILYNTAITPLVALQAVIFICAINYKKYVRGLGMLSGRMCVDSVFTLSSTVLGVYYIFLALMGAANGLGGVAYNLYLTPMALLALYAALSGYVDSIRTLNAFKIISQKDPKVKHVLTVKTKEEDTEERYSPDGGNVISVEKTGFVSDFVKWSNTEYKECRHCKWLVTLSLIVSVVLFLYKMISGAGIVSAFSVGVMSMMLTMPFSLYFSYSFIFGFAAVVASSEGCAIVGDGAFEEYPAGAAVYFDDASVFPPSNIKLKGFRAYGDNRIDKLLYILSAIYKKLRSPAAILFERAVGGFEGEFALDILDVGQTGVRVAVNGSTVFVGGADYMKDCGFEIEDAAEDEDISPEISVVYMAIGHSVVMKAYLEYTLDKKMIKTAEILKKHGMYLGICTYDPCINDGMMNVRIPLEKYPIGIMKSKSSEAEPQARKIGGGIVSVKGPDNLLGALLTVVRASHSFKTDMIIKGFTFFSGVVLSVLFALFAQEGGVGIWYMIFYQIFAAVPTVVMLSSIND